MMAKKVSAIMKAYEVQVRMDWNQYFFSRSEIIRILEFSVAQIKKQSIFKQIF
jgi:hypothetical protein